MRHVVVVLLLASFGAAEKDYLPRPYCRDNSSCDFKGTSHTDLRHHYEVHGIKVIVKYEAMKLLELSCYSQSLAVDDPDMPAMNELREVKEVKISSCSTPFSTSYADALNKMNVQVTESLKLSDSPADPRLDFQHFAGLSISDLEIKVVSGPPQRPTKNYLDGLSGLRSLNMFNVIPDPESLMRLPDALEYLELWHAELPSAERELGNGSAWLERLPSLRNLTLEELDLEEPNSTKKLTMPAFKSLPYLTKLSLKYIKLDSSNLAGKLNGSSIKHLIMRSCGLNTLPDKLFQGANLTSLDLALNNLTVKEGLFSPLQWLTELDLEESQVDSADLVNIVSTLPQLEILKASNNPLKSLCDDADISSKLTWPQKLRQLDLSKTNITRICPNWIDNDALLEANLSHNDIKNLNYNDLKMKPVHAPTAVTIDLTNNPNLRIVNVSITDIKQCRNHSTSLNSYYRTQPKVIIKLNMLNDVQCDKDAFLLQEVVRNCPWLQFDRDIFTNLRYNYAASQPHEILCEYKGSCLPDCSCHKRPRDNATVVHCNGALAPSPPWPPTAHEYPLALYMEPGTLDRVPRGPKLVELHAAGNNISSLDEDDITDTLLILNVSYNKIRHISKEVAQKLSDIETTRSVYLQGNKLACNCSVAQVLELLRHVVLDLDQTQCVDEFNVLEKMEILNFECALPVLPMLFVLLSILLVLLMIGLLLHRYKPQIRQLLFKLNWCHRFIFGVKDDDAEKNVDVFLSYAHKDIEVLQELKIGLEARGYTTLEHNRDWHPGVPILDQIVLSVKSARRTLLLVSDSYADSPWAVKEFHAAHAHAMERQTARVLVVTHNLHQPEKLPPDLQLYLKYNTYLDRHDVNFWEKLCSAMPMRFQISS